MLVVTHLIVPVPLRQGKMGCETERTAGKNKRSCRNRRIRVFSLSKRKWKINRMTTLNGMIITKHLQTSLLSLKTRHVGHIETHENG